MRVSIIMPCSRPEDLPRAIEVYKSQDYPDKELSILMDVEGYTKDTDPGNKIWQWGTKEKLTIGAKRNELIRFAQGEIIVNFDSDDWYAPDYVSRAVELLIESKANIAGLSRAYFFKPTSNLWLYQSPSKAYVIGSAMTYYRSVWERQPFLNKNSGEDLDFQTNAGKITQLDYLNGFMAMIHGNNTASHNSLSVMKRVNPEIAESILGECYNLYQP